MGLLKSYNNKLLKTGTNYSLASSLSSIVTMLITLISMRWIGPDQLGVWQSLAILNSYIIFFQLGIQSGLNLELPIVLGRGEKKMAEEYISTALSFAIIVSFILLLLGALLVAYFAKTGKSSIFIYTSIAIVVMAVVDCYKLHYIATFRSAIAFDKLARIYYIDLFINLLFIPLIYFLSYKGYLLYQVGRHFFFTLLLFIYAPYRNVRPKFISISFKNLLKRGIFMTFVNQTKGIIESSSRLLILRFGSILMVGLFSPALSIRTAMDMIPSQVSQFLNPQFGYKYGKTGKASDMWPYLQKASLLIPIVCVPFVILGWFLMPWVLEFFFPKYLDSLLAIGITLCGFAFSSTYITRGFLITIKAYKEVISLYFMDLILFWGVPFALIKLSPTDVMYSVSLGLSIAYFCSYIVNYFIVKKVVFKGCYNL